MIWRDTARWCSVTLAMTSVMVTLARPASAQDIERLLAGIRLNSKSSTVLAKFGNPNEVVIGDIGVRGAGPGSNGNGGQGQGLGSGFTPPTGGFGGVPRGSSGPPPGFSGGSPPPGFGGGGKVRGGVGADTSGPRVRPQAPVFGGGQGLPQPPDGGGGNGGGFGFPGQGGNGGGPGIGAFGQLGSTVARQQEVTWVYNRKVNNNLVTYEFLIGPSGQVIQIRATGYKGGTARTRRGIALGSTYKNVVRAYGFPEEHLQVGRTLVASYKKTGHVQFQFLNARGSANPMDDGNKVISITIATVE